MKKLILIKLVLILNIKVVKILLILFCCDPLDKKRVDADYMDEYNAATGSGLFETSLIERIRLRG
jgi:hypothetical protein